MVNNVSTNCFQFKHLLQQGKIVTFEKQQNHTNSTIFKNSQLSNIAPQMLGITFKGVSSGKEDIKTIKNILQAYSYGKADIINSPDNFKVDFANNSFRIHGFRNPNPKSKIGICEELTYKAGIELQEKLGHKYIFVPTKGVCSQYNLQHCYLLAFEKNNENQEKTNSIIAKSMEATEIAMKSMQDIRDGNFDIKKMTVVQSKLAQLSPKPNDLKNALLIDPSFHIVKQFGDEGIIDGYSQNLFLTFEKMNPFKENIYTVPAIMNQAELPIGFVKDFAPELSGVLHPNTMLILKLLSDNGKARFAINSMEVDDILSSPVDLQNLDSKNKLNNFINY